MHVIGTCSRRSLFFISLLILISWSGSNSAGSLPPDVQISGTWDCSFSGTVQGKGTSQTDTLVMDLNQNGSRVTGTLRFNGLDVSFPVSGKVTGTKFTYIAKAIMGPNCEAAIEGEMTFDERANEMTGSQTQVNCEGKAVGKVAATRR